MKEKYYSLVDKYGRIAICIKARSIHQARKKIKRVKKEDLLKIRELVIGE